MGIVAIVPGVSGLFVINTARSQYILTACTVYRHVCLPSQCSSVASGEVNINWRTCEARRHQFNHHNLCLSSEAKDVNTHILTHLRRFCANKWKPSSGLYPLLAFDMPPCSKNQSVAFLLTSQQMAQSHKKCPHWPLFWSLGGDFYGNHSSLVLCFVMNGTMRQLSIKPERLLCHYVTVPLSWNEGKCWSLNLLTESFCNNFCFDI